MTDELSGDVLRDNTRGTAVFSLIYRTCASQVLGCLAARGAGDPEGLPVPDVVEEILLDAGHQEDAELRAALTALAALASPPAPAPSVELAALLAGSTARTGGGGDDELSRSR